MNRALFFSFFVAIAIQTIGQITVNNTTFPGVGDTLHLAVNANPDISLLGPGGPFIWDFTAVQEQVDQSLVYRVASEGSISVSGATLFAEYPGGVENYYKATGNAFELLAVKGPVGQVFGVESVFKYQPPRIERHAPLNYLDDFTTTSNLLIPFSTENIPSEIIDSLGLPIVPDSIRLRVASELTDEVDAFGMVKLPIGDFDALRVKRTDALETRIDVLLPFFGWQDVTDVLAAGGLIPGLGVDTMRSYLFISDTEKEVLLNASLDSTGQNIQQAIFKSGDSVNATHQENGDFHQPVSVYPNPFSDQLFIRLHRQANAPLEVKFFSTEGALLVSEVIDPSGGSIYKCRTLPEGAGVYIYQVTDQQGQIIQEGKLVKI